MRAHIYLYKGAPGGHCFDEYRLTVFLNCLEATKGKIQKVNINTPFMQASTCIIKLIWHQWESENLKPRQWESGNLNSRQIRTYFPNSICLC